MLKAIFFALALSACSDPIPRYEVTRRDISTPMFACQFKAANTSLWTDMRICKDMEDCNSYCEKLRNGVIK